MTDRSFERGVMIGCVIAVVVCLSGMIASWLMMPASAIDLLSAIVALLGVILGAAIVQFFLALREYRR